MDSWIELQDDPNFQQFLQENPAVRFLEQPQVEELFQSWIRARTFQIQESVLVPRPILNLLIQQHEMLAQLLAQQNSKFPDSEWEPGEIPEPQPDELDEVPDPFIFSEDDLEREIASLTESSVEESEVNQGEINAD